MQKSKEYLIGSCYITEQTILDVEILSIINYYLIEIKSRENLMKHAIKLVKLAENNIQESIISEFSILDKSVIIQIINKLIENSVTPMCFEDILDDLKYWVCYGL